MPLPRCQFEDRNAQRRRAKLAIPAIGFLADVHFSRIARVVVREPARTGDYPGHPLSGQLRAFERQIDGLRLFGGIHDGHRQGRPVGRPGSRHIERRRRAGYLDRSYPETLAIQLQDQAGRLHLRTGWRGLDRPDHVHGLRVVRHEVDIRIAEEFVEPGGNPQPVLHGVTDAQLTEVVRSVPVVPLVHRDADILAGQRGEPAAVFAVCVGHSADLRRNLGHMRRELRPVLPVQMLTDEIHEIGALREHLLAPSPHVANADGPYAGINLAHGLDYAVMLLYVLFERHVAELPRAIHLVAYREPLHAKRLRVAVLGAKLAQGRAGGTVEVLHLLRGGALVGQAGIHGDIGFRADLAHQRHVLVNADVVGLDALPCGILARWPLVRIADAVLPVVAADEVAARPPVHRRVQLLEQRQRVRAPAVDVVRRHQRYGADPERAGTPGDDLQPAIVRGASCA